MTTDDHEGREAPEPNRLPAAIERSRHRFPVLNHAGTVDVGTDDLSSAMVAGRRAARVGGDVYAVCHRPTGRVLARYWPAVYTGCYGDSLLSCGQPTDSDEPYYPPTPEGRAQLAVDRSGHDTHGEARGER